MTSAVPWNVSRFENRLLRILRFFLQRGLAEEALPLLVSSCPQPTCLGRAAVRLVQDMLSKGCPLLLARAGGWRRGRHLRGERSVEGRLWERTPPNELGLSFSRHTLAFLIWVTAVNVKERKERWEAPEAELTVGDRLLFYLIWEAVRDTEVGEALLPLPVFARNGLCWLAYPKDFADQRGPAGDMAPWVSGTGASVLEALQPRLAERWLALERSKEALVAWRSLRALGQAQEKALTAFLTAADAAGRRDLARFLLQATAALLRDDPPARRWLGTVEFTGQRLADRVETYRAALALLRALDHLQAWEQQARTVGYFDEGYAASQLWKSEWEQWCGDVLHAQAQAIVRQVEPLKT